MFTAKHFITLLAFTIPGLMACNSSDRERHTVNQTEKVDTAIAVSLPAPLLNEDTVLTDHSFPSVDSLSAKVLTVGVFHSDEVWETAANENWLGLFHSKNGFYLAAAKLKTKRIHDEIVDTHENQKTGWEVRTVNQDSSIILIEGLPYLTPRKVEKVALSKPQVWPGDSLRFNYLGVDYTIFATGDKKKVNDDPLFFEVWNYKLYIMATIRGQQLKSLLVAHENFDDQMTALEFAGDIDGDGILDLIINTSRHYNATIPTIYLSRPAENRELVKPVGAHTSVGC